MIIQGLREIQDRRGYLPDEELELLALLERIPLARVHEVASFYPSFRRAAPCPLEVGICRDLSCQLRGAVQLLREAGQYGDRDVELRVEGVSCLGRCEHAPVVQIRRHEQRGRRWVKVLDEIHSVPDPRALRALVGATRGTGVPAGPGLEALDVIRRSGRDQVSPRWKIDIYDRELYPNAPAPYESVRRFERGDLTRESIVAAFETAELEGMGGASGQASNKWKTVLVQQDSPRYVVGNGDESEPGTFKDRELMLRVPHLIVEAMVLALRFLNAKEGYLYVRHEYRPSIEALRSTIAEAEELFRREQIFGPEPELPFRIEVAVSPGGYICGEQSALLEALADQRAQPRLQNLARDIQRNGLFHKPTILNNVETLAWVPAVVLKDGGRWYAAQGFDHPGFDESGKPKHRERYPGLRFFSVSGAVNRPGVYEVPMGASLRELIEGTQYAGGLSDKKGLRAIASSGPSSGFLPAEFEVSELRRRLQAGLRTARPNQKDRLERFLGNTLSRSGRVSVLDLELAAPLFRALGTMLGGGIVVYGLESTPDMVGPALCASEFFRNESCGKCVPCRLGSQQLADFAARLARGGYSQQQWNAEGVKPMIEALSMSLELTSICSLGRVAANPLTSLINDFPGDVRNHLM
jgi:NADH:ubiquinone oxidoreductase subunit F (NADH-binding)/NADH:ubiquinone oxidoreductase subunit E